MQQMMQLRYIDGNGLEQVNGFLFGSVKSKNVKHGLLTKIGLSISLGSIHFYEDAIRD